MIPGKKKILVFVDWFYPGYRAGGPIQSCLNFCLVMKDFYDIDVITTDKDLGEQQPYHNVISDQWQTFSVGVRVYYCSTSSISYATLLNQLKISNPDYIYLNHLFSYNFVILPLIMGWRKQINATVILSPRGALYESALRHKNTYLKKMTFLTVAKTIGLFKNVQFHATNDVEKKLVQTYFSNCRVFVANNLPDFNQKDFVSIGKQPGQLRIAFIARILPIKNLTFALEVLKQLKSAVSFQIIGPLEDRDYWRDCEKLIGQLPENCTVEYLGPKEKTEVTTILRQQHILFLPTQSENFGHSIFEAFSAGRPVVISSETPWKRLQEKKIGWDIPLSDARAFVDAIEHAAAWTQGEFDEYAYLAWQFAKSYKQASTDIEKYKSIFQ